MTGYVVRRALASIPVLFIVSLVVFSLLHFSPGDPAAIIAGQDATQLELDGIREHLGLNRPLPVQYGVWLAGILRGDLGQSILSKHRVAGLIRERAVPTLFLALFTEVFAIFVGIPLGVLAAWKANTKVDRTVMIVATLGFSVPVFWLGFILIYSFAVRLPLFPVAGYVHPTDGVGPFLHRLILPAFATGTIIMALIARMTRASVLEVLQEDYIRTARATGRPEERSPPHRHRHRAWGRRAARRSSDHRDRLCHPGPRSSACASSPGQGLPHHPGPDPRYVRDLRRR